MIDVRHPAEVEQRPLVLPQVELINIPFFNLEQQFNSLDKASSYLLYCDKGIMSRLQAQLMREKGFKQVAIFTPTT
ncbi:MAG: thiazole biosynthesis protein [Porticoccaceae bacterium]